MKKLFILIAAALLLCLSVSFAQVPVVEEATRKMAVKDINTRWQEFMSPFVDANARPDDPVGRGQYHFVQAVAGAGLGGIPYRDGTYEYYVNEPRRDDDLKAIGPFIQACIEMELMKKKK